MFVLLLLQQLVENKFMLLLYVYCLVTYRTYRTYRTYKTYRTYRTYRTFYTLARKLKTARLRNT